MVSRENPRLDRTRSGSARMERAFEMVDDRSIVVGRGRAIVLLLHVVIPPVRSIAKLSGRPQSASGPVQGQRSGTPTRSEAGSGTRTGPPRLGGVTVGVDGQPALGRRAITESEAAFGLGHSRPPVSRSRCEPRNSGCAISYSQADGAFGDEVEVPPALGIGPDGGVLQVDARTRSSVSFLLKLALGQDRTGPDRRGRCRRSRCRPGNHRRVRSRDLEPQGRISLTWRNTLGSAAGKRRSKGIAGSSVIPAASGPAAEPGVEIARFVRHDHAIPTSEPAARVTRTIRMSGTSPGRHPCQSACTRLRHPGSSAHVAGSRPRKRLRVRSRRRGGQSIPWSGMRQSRGHPGDVRWKGFGALRDGSTQGPVRARMGFAPWRPRRPADGRLSGRRGSSSSTCCRTSSG